MAANLSLLNMIKLLALIIALLFPDKIYTSQVVERGIIGTVLDCSSRVGKEERIAMEMAIEDLSKQKNQTLILHVKCSRGEPVQAALAARHLMIKNKVQIILGPNSWEESSAIAGVAKQFNIPIVSFASSAPMWATEQFPLLIQASSSTSNQMKAIASIVQSWMWRRVSVIYEDTDYSANDILTHLYEALGEVQVQMSNLVPLPSMASFDKLHSELEKLKNDQCRVFVIHTSLPLAESIFSLAKKMKMMNSGYVWITTDSITSLVHSMNASVIFSMQGVIGVKRYFSEMGEEFNDFSTSFVEKFHQRYPEEKNHEPGIFALQAYDATRMVGSTINSSNSIMEKIKETNLTGLCGKIQFRERKLTPTTNFQIINIIGKSYRELGFWSSESGNFSTEIDSTFVDHPSMEILGHVLWPGRTLSTPRGWVLPTISNPLKIGVPNGSLTNKFVNVEFNPSTKKYVISGFSVEVFRRTVQHLNYSLPYELIPYGGSYTDLVKQVQLKEFDGAVGDIAITSNRYDYVEFTHAHTQPGVVMIVPIKSHRNQAWLFLKPFTGAMWLLTGLINIYNGFVIWSIERNYSSQLKGPLMHQLGTLIWLAFATFLSLNGERLNSSLSKMATVVWLFVALIITQSYTASLSSMLTIQHIEPKVTNIETLKSENAFVGYSQRSFMKGYLETALHFNTNNIKSFTHPDEYAKALKNGDISAAFLEVPVANLFVAKYCKSFIIAGPTYKVGGYGYAFPKGSPLLPDLDEAFLHVLETGVLKDLENNLISSEKCLDAQLDNETVSLSPHSFFVLFIFSGGTSTTALIIYYFHTNRKVENSMAEHKGIWMLLFILLENWKNRRIRRFSRKVSDVPSSYPNSQHPPEP